MPEVSWQDEKGRTRWYRNDDVADIVRQLGEYLIIGGYPEEHAKRYAQIAHTISRWPESVDVLASDDKLNSLPGVGGVITSYLQEIIETGTTIKFDDDQYGSPPPRSVLELTAIPGLGAKTARRLYQEKGIDSLGALCTSLQDGRLDSVQGIGLKMRATIGDLCERSY